MVLFGCSIIVCELYFEKEYWESYVIVWNLGVFFCFWFSYWYKRVLDGSIKEDVICVKIC